MKRVVLALLGLFCAANLCIAQVWPAKHERGIASQEMRAGGLSAAHSSIPIGTKVKIINLANGLEIEATVISHIPESNQRIIDLSPSAARALDIVSSGPVLIAPLSQQLPIPPVTPSAVTTAPAVKPQAETDADAEKLPLSLTINNYMGPEKMAENEPERPIRQHRFWPEPEPIPIVELPPPPPPPPPEPEPEPEPVKPSLFTSPPVTNVQIIPGLPDPHTGKIYRLLVGTYSGVDSAFLIYRQLEAAGFTVIQEQAGDMCKVFAAGIPAARVYYAAMRLGAIGFSQVWIHE